MPTTPRLGREAGQSESLVKRLRGLVRDYPAGVGILKEFLQNADDAGASAVRFRLDLRKHPFEGAPDPRMERLYGPALLVENDKPFGERDHAAIQELQDGHKRDEARSTGRFGLGFNTAYNLTDYPAFATGDRIVCFDPHEEAVAAPAGKLPGRSWLLEELWRAAPGWPRLFGVEEGALWLERTVFRLALREADRCGPDRISMTPFTPEDARRVLDQAETWGSALLLFLRSVTELHVEVTEAGGESRHIMSITSREVDHLTDERRRLADALKEAASLTELWDHLERTPGGLPELLYEHTFDILSATPRTERWLVAQGATLDEGGEVMKAARHLLGIGEKPLPIVGAAVRLPDEPGGAMPTVVGHLYCTLPLPEPIGLPFHVNAFVDLDSARRQPTFAADALGNAAIRVRWNEALLHHLVPKVSERLLDAVTDRILDGELDPGAGYTMCPRLSTPTTKWGVKLARDILKALAPVCFIPHEEDGEFSALMDASECELPAKAWSASLRDALHRDGLRMAHPAPAQALIADLVAVGHPLAEVSPKAVRDWLKATPTGEWSIEDAPRACLRSRANIHALLDFCGEKKTATLTGLPLGIKTDNQLQTFGHGTVLFADTAIRALFPSRTHWFWEDAVRSRVTPAQVGHSGEMSVLDIVTNLKTYVGDGWSYASWNSGAETPPNIDWLEKVLHWLRGAKIDDSSLATLTQRPLVPSKRGELLALGSAATPLLAVPEVLQKHFDALGLPRVEASTAVVRALEALAEKQSNLLWRCSAQTLVAALSAVSRETLCSPDVTTAVNELLVYFAEQHQRNPVGKDCCDSLKSLPLWRTAEGDAVSANTPGILRASGFNPPPGLVELKLIHPPPGESIAHLLSTLGVKELNLDEFAFKIMPSLYQASSEGDKARQWYLDAGHGQCDATTRSRVRESLRVHDHKGGMRLARELLDFRSATEIKVMGDTLPLPGEAYRSTEWLKLLADLGMRDKLNANDLGKRVQALRQNDPTGATREPFIAVLKYVDDRVRAEAKDTPQNRPDNEAVNQFAKDLCSGLRNVEWIPATRSEIASTKQVHPSPSRLLKPEDCLPLNAALLVGNQVYLLPIHVDPRVISALGVTTRPSEELVLLQLGNVGMRLQCGETPESLIDYQRELLAWVARRSDPQGWADRPCVAIGNRLWKPKHVYIADVSWLEGMRAQRPEELQEQDEVLRKIGCRQVPTLEQASEIILELPQSPLSPEIRHKVAIQVFQRFAVEMKERQEGLRGKASTLWHAPTRAGGLVLLSQCLHDDAPWWTTHLQESPVNWLHHEIDPALALGLGARSASSAIHERYLSGRATEGNEKTAHGLESRLRAPLFRDAMMRLLHHDWNDFEQVRTFAPELERLLSCGVRLMQELKTQLILDDRPIAEAEAEVAADKRAIPPVIRILNGSPKDIRRRMSTALAVLLGAASLDNNAALEDLLDAEHLKDLSAILDRRRIRAFMDFVAPTYEDELRNEQPPEQEAEAPEIEELSSDEEDNGAHQNLNETSAVPDKEELPEGHDLRDRAGVSGTPSTVQGGRGEVPEIPYSRVVNVVEHTRSPPIRGFDSEPSGEKVDGRKILSTARPGDSGSVQPPENPKAGRQDSDRRSDPADPDTNGNPTGEHFVEGHWRSNPTGRSGATSVRLTGEVNQGAGITGTLSSAQSPPFKRAVDLVPGNQSPDAHDLDLEAIRLVSASCSRQGIPVNLLTKKPGPDIFVCGEKGWEGALVRGLRSDFSDGVAELYLNEMAVLLDSSRPCWLYVVASVMSERPIIYRIFDPLRHTRGFRFGPEWHEAWTGVIAPAKQPMPLPTPQQESPKQPPSSGSHRTRSGRR